MDKPLFVRGDAKTNFWRKVQKGDSCWLWTGARTRRGYGHVRIGGKTKIAHRVSYEWSRGAIPDGKVIDHICHTTSCVNPDHLRAVTNAENRQNLSGAHSGSSSGVRGVTWADDKGAWAARVGLYGQRHHFGYYSTKAEAEKVVVAWRREHMPYSEMDKKKESA